MQSIDKKYRRIISRILLVTYLFVSAGFVFHYHHINLTAEAIVLSQNLSTKNSTTSGTNHNEFVCIIHSNFQSLHTALQSQLFECFTSFPFRVLNFIDIDNQGIKQLQHNTANPLRAPPVVS